MTSDRLEESMPAPLTLSAFLPIAHYDYPPHVRLYHIILLRLNAIPPSRPHRRPQTPLPDIELSSHAIPYIRAQLRSNIHRLVQCISIGSPMTRPIFASMVRRFLCIIWNTFEFLLINCPGNEAFDAAEGTAVLYA